MTLREDVQRFIIESGEDISQEGIPLYIAEQFESWDSEELVALGTILILKGAETEPKQTLHVTCRLHKVLHILQNVDQNARQLREGY